MITVAIVDDHHAVRLGLYAAIRSEPDLVNAGMATNAAELAPLLYRTHPDVVVLDHHLPGDDGLNVCWRIKRDVPAPRVILSAFAGASMTVPALVAGADGLLDKTDPTPELMNAIRDVARGGHAVPPIQPPLLEEAARVLEPDDLPILSMLVQRTPPNEIARTLRLDRITLRQRTAGILRRLRTRLRGAT